MSAVRRTGRWPLLQLFQLRASFSVLILFYAAPNFALLKPPTLPPLSRSFTINSTYISPRCLGKYSCDPNNQDIRECSCQPYCYLFDTCCAESMRPDVRGQNLPSYLYSCLQAEQLTGGFPSVDNSPSVYVVDHCPSDGFNASLMSTYCQHPLASINDGTLSAPVTHAVTMVTYRNIYCALCNNMSRSDVVSWIAQRICYASGDAAGITASRQNCTTGYLKPDMNASTYDCRPSVVQTCPMSVSMTLPGVASACSDGPAAYVYNWDQQKIYRNWNCTLCDAGTLVDGGLTLTSASFECTMWQTGPVYSSPVGANVTSSSESSRDYWCPASFAQMTLAEQVAWQQLCPPADLPSSAALDNRGLSTASATLGYRGLLTSSAALDIRGLLHRAIATCSIGLIALLLVT